jgi:hypothetical protein
MDKIDAEKGMDMRITASPKVHLKNFMSALKTIGKNG